MFVKIWKNITKYFNIDLKSVLKYDTDYEGQYIQNSDTLALLGNSEELFLMFLTSDTLLLKVKNTIELGIKKLFRQISSVDIFLIDSFSINIKINIDPFYLEDIPDIGILANIFFYLDKKNLIKMMYINKKFIKINKEMKIWVELFRLKFPNLSYKELSKKLELELEYIPYNFLYRGTLYYEENILKSKGYFSGKQYYYPLVTTFLIDQKMIDDSNVLIDRQNLIKSTNITGLDLIYEVYPNIFKDFKLQMIDIGLEKFLWIKAKIKHTILIDELLYKFNQISLSDADKIVKMLPIDINIIIIYNIIKDIIRYDKVYHTKSNESSKFNLVFEKYKSYLPNNYLIDIISLLHKH